MQLQIVTFLWFVVYTSEALKCNHCLARSSDHCTSEGTIECVNDSGGCGAASGFFKNGMKNTKFIYKGCKFPIPCTSWLRISMNGTYIQSYITCCEGELCDLGYYIPSDEDELANSKVCESCYKEGTKEGCDSTQMQQCRGDEVLCMDYRGLVLKDGAETAISFKGCANQFALDYFQYFYNFEELQFAFLIGSQAE